MNAPAPAPPEVKKPVLIYDGDCGFCGYWARYWQKLTGEAVDYRPYQDAAAEYPDITVDDFRSAVQYIAPDGKKARAAEASFLTLSHAEGKGFWLGLYRKLPGFAAISEWAYAFIARHRPAFYRISLFLWGRNYAPPRFELVSWLFLRALGLVFLAAFVSFGVQATGLIGSRGILPLTDYIALIKDRLGTEGYWRFPMVFFFSSGDFIIQAVCWMGAALSLLLTFNIFQRTCLALLYVFYLSLLHAGQSFMTFQWDLFLLEAGVLGILLATSTMTGIWLLRWLLFRFMFLGGAVKLLSSDPTWQNLSALNYHFETQPLPTPLGWYAAKLPEGFLSFSTGATLFIELLLPFFIFLPRRLRFFAGYGFLLFQFCIILTGNYNFFNFLTVALCLVLFDDASINKLFAFLRRFSPPVPKRNGKAVSIAVSAAAIFTLLVSDIQLYQKFGREAPKPLAWLEKSVSPFAMVNTYGPFAVMTVRRPEIVIEGSSDDETWQEYGFKYKPGDLSRRPLWNIPHQPRLDWQMWFAALGTPDGNPWFANFLQRLLENEPSVTALLENNPFPDTPPLYVRARIYIYRFTTAEEREETGNAWSRELLGLYYPAIQAGQ